MANNVSYADTPQTLSTFAARRFASMIINSTIPHRLYLMLFRKFEDSEMQAYIIEEMKVDRILLGNQDVEDSFMKNPEEKSKPFEKCRIVQMKKWWDDSEWLSTTHPAHKHIEMAISYLLTTKFYDGCNLPLLKFILDLIFTKKIGKFRLMGQHHYERDNYLDDMNAYCELTKKDSVKFCLLLRALGTFNIRILEDRHSFSSREPFIQILENSPHLEELYIRYRTLKSALSGLKLHCRHLTKISIVHGAEVKSDTLYRAFFCGLSQKEVSQKIKTSVEVETSFPKLAKLILSREMGLKRFIRHVNRCYPNVVHVSMEFEPFLTDYFLHQKFYFVPIDSTGETFAADTNPNIVSHLFDERDYFRGANCPIYKIKTIAFTPKCILSLRKDKQVLLRMLPNVKRIILEMDGCPGVDLEILASKTKELLSWFSFAELQIYIPPECLLDQDIEKVLLPAVELIGRNIKFLTLTIFHLRSFSLYNKLINACSNNLKELCINIFATQGSYPYNVNLARLNFIPSLEVLKLHINPRGFPDEVRDDQWENGLLLVMNTFIKQIFWASRVVKIAEFYISDCLPDFLKSVYKEFGKLTILRLNFGTFCTDDIFLPEFSDCCTNINAQPGLKKLVLVKPNMLTLRLLRRMYDSTRLEICLGEP